MNTRGPMFGRGNINVNQSETKYLTNFWLVAAGIFTILIFDIILLFVIWFGFESSIIGLLIVIILLGIIHILIYSVSSYLMRGFYREDAFDWANLLAIALNQNLANSSGVVSNALSTIQAAKKESRNEIQSQIELEKLIYDLSKLRDELQNKSEDGFVPLINGE